MQNFGFPEATSSIVVLKIDISNIDIMKIDVSALFSEIACHIRLKFCVEIIGLVQIGLVANDNPIKQ